MAQPSSPLDPLGLWRELVAQWEKGSNEFANQAMASDPFRQGMHGGMGASLQLQKGLGELMARYLGSLNLPSRDDVQTLGDQLQSIDEHLGRIARLLEQRGAGALAGDTATTTAGPRRTRQPPVRAAAPPAPAPHARRRKS